MSLQTRIRALESAPGGGDCPECGNGPADDERSYEIVFVDRSDVRPDEWCGACGRALHIAIHMDW